MMMSTKLQSMVTAVPLASIIFYAGCQVNRIDELFTIVHAAEVERKDARELLFDIHGKVCSIEKDIKNIEKKLES